jgi:PAS domain S-box-containing protein
MGNSIDVIEPERFRLISSKNRERLVKEGPSLYTGKTAEGIAVRKGGVEFPAEISISFWRIGDQSFFSGIARDITQRKQQEESPRASEERFRAIAESSPDAIVTTDSNMGILYWNKAAENIYGYTAEEIAGKSLITIWTEKSRVFYKTNKAHYSKGNLPVHIGKTFEQQCVRKDESKFPVEISTSYWKINDQVYFSGIMRDITQRKQMEEQLRKSHEELEKKVMQRTAELRKANDELQISQKYLKKFASMLLSVREDERKNISVTLHDELGSMALSVTSKISIAKEEVKDNNAEAALKTLEEGQAAVRKAVADLRKLAVDLRPPNLEIMGLNEALTNFVDRAKEQTKLKIVFRNELGNKKISEDMAIVIYRVIQEALTNIMKHAKAKTARISLYAEKRNINLEISDDGVGCDLKKVLYRKGKPKIGIQGMRERVESLRGEFIITSAPTQGTQLKAMLPKY